MYVIIDNLICSCEKAETRFCEIIVILQTYEILVDKSDPMVTVWCHEAPPNDARL